MKITGLVEIWGKLAEPKTLPLKWRIVFVTVAFIGAVACVSLGYDTPAPLALDLLFLTVFCALFIYGSIVALGIAVLILLLPAGLFTLARDTLHDSIRNHGRKEGILRWSIMASPLLMIWGMLLVAAGAAIRDRFPDHLPAQAVAWGLLGIGLLPMLPALLALAAFYISSLRLFIFGSAAILPVLSALLLLVNVMHIDLRQKGWAQWITGVLVTLGVYYGSNWWEKPLKRVLARLRRVHRLLPHMVALLISFSSLWVLGKFALPFREGTAGIDFDSKIPSVKVSVSPQAISAYEQAAQNLADIMEQSEDDE